LFAVPDTLTEVLRVIGFSPYNGMAKIYDIWIRAVIESEKAKEIPGLNPEVFPNIQFTRTAGTDPENLSDSQWRKVMKKLFKQEGVRAPDHGLEREQEVSIICKQLEGEQFRGTVKIPTEYVGENPEESIESIY
jgi:hypothetical protein